MVKGFLVKADGQRVAVGPSLVIGRTRDCGLIIDDTAASRRHVEIALRDGRFYWKDLGSTNGTALNGAPMLMGMLRHGDTLRIGETEFRFEIEETQDTPAPIKDDSRIFQETIIDAQGQTRSGIAARKTTKLLEALYTVVNEIATNYEPCRLMDHVLRTTVRAINAQRGAILLAGEGERLLPCPDCGKVHRILGNRLAPADQHEIPISGSVVRRVLQGGESVLYQDKDRDADLNVAESIVQLKLRSILCVPLRAKHGILGVLYMDSDRAGHTYGEDDLLLAAAVGNSAGIALENARMHHEMLDKQRIEQEIETAWTIQEGFLVRDWPDTDPRLQVFGETLPAKVVGGDFYDFVRPGPDIVGMLIGDVSGKGVPAALTMAQLLAEFRLLAREAQTPAQVLAALNADLVTRSRRGLFCTLAYLMVDLRNGRVVCANAGHHPVLWLHGGTAEFRAEASGPPAGILPKAQWKDEVFNIQPGDSLLLYTDGIVEARGTATARDPLADLPEFGSEGLCAAAAGSAGAPPQGLIECVQGAVRQFCAPSAPQDDCTLIALRYLGATGGTQ